MEQVEEDRFQEIDCYVGQVIARIRKEQRLSRKILSNLLHISPTQLHKYELGINRISPGKLYILAEFLKVPVWEFFPLQLQFPPSERQSEELHRAFQRLPDPYTKTRVVELVQCMAYGPKAQATGTG